MLTFREGVLARLGHDLELAVTRFAIKVDDEAKSVTATFDPTSLQVVRALRDGVELPAALSPSDQATIEQAVETDVLDARQHPEISFRSTTVAAAEGGWNVEGVLALAGVERPLRLSMRWVDDRWAAEVPLHVPDWGITPYRALLGTLKVKADVIVRLSLPGVN